MKKAKKTRKPKRLKSGPIDIAKIQWDCVQVNSYFCNARGARRLARWLLAFADWAEEKKP